MADSNIGSLPAAASMADDALLVMEQQGAARKLTGAQLKAYAKQGVELEFQEDLAAAEAAADRAESAVNAVANMTVSAQTLENGQPATVAKTVQNNVFHLAFGIPRGQQGIQGTDGKTGPQGPKGDPGKGLTILGYYDTPAALEAAQPAPDSGDAYGIGTAAPYDIYVYDGVSNIWKNNGPLSGGGGSILPENVVTSEGGAVLQAPSASFGEAPHTIQFTDEEGPPLTAEDVQYTEQKSVKDAIDGLFTSVGDGKETVASAITDMGVPTAQDAAFETMAENIRKISGGTDTSDATATPGDILAPKTAYTASGKVQGIIPAKAAQTFTPGTSDQTIASGQYLSGTQTIKGDVNLTPANIRSGVSVFGVNGEMTSQFKATLTVTADTGAVVTATHSGGTEVSGLSTNGSVTLELPVEGEWTVTAVRGMAQYNSVVVNVSSSYSAALTAEVHIVRVGEITPIGITSGGLAAAANERYALFGGGKISDTSVSSSTYAYNNNLERLTVDSLSAGRRNLAAASVGQYILFAGGYSPKSSDDNYYNYLPDVDAFDLNGTRTLPEGVSRRAYIAGISFGDYALFGGGRTSGNQSTENVYAYDEVLTRTSPTSLISARHNLGAAANEKYALFGGGYNRATYFSLVDAYDSFLTRSTPVSLSIDRDFLSAARAGNYIIFAGGYLDYSIKNETDAYDLFLTRTTPDKLYVARQAIGAATLKNYAIFAGGMEAYGTTGGTGSKVVDVYDPYLVHTTTDPLGKGRSGLVGTTIANFALFGGGTTNGNTVDAYQYV